MIWNVISQYFEILPGSIVVLVDHIMYIVPM